MPTRDGAPLGAPCWIDLWTSDVYGRLSTVADPAGAQFKLRSV